MEAENHEPCPESQRATYENDNELMRKGFSKEEILAEMKKQLALAGPLVLLYICFTLMIVISISFVGHLGELPLSGASLASSFASMVGYTLLRGLGSALETFCGQSYGAKQNYMLGVYLQRAVFVLEIVSVPIGIILANTSHILKLFRQNAEISKEAGHYAFYLIPGMFAVSIMECNIRFLQAQNNVVPMMINSGVCLILHVIICWILVFKSGLKGAGAALATSISYWIGALLLSTYVWSSPSCKETWLGFKKEALRGIPKFLKLAIPSTIMISLAVCSLEIMVLLSGLLPDPKLETSVMSISFNIYFLFSMITLGLGAVVSTRVSNELGAGRPRAARLAVLVAIITVITEGILVATVMVSGHKVFGVIYSKEEKVVKYVGQMLLLVAVSHIIDGIQCVLSGTCRGCGWQKLGAFVNLGAYYFIGIPTAVVLAFVCHLGGKGLWIGVMVAFLVQAVILAIITLSTNWEKQAEDAKNRVFSH